MLPMSYIIALIASTLLILYRLVDITNKYVNILLSAVLSFITGASWGYIAITENNLHLWGSEPTFLSNLIIMVIVGLIVGFILMVITWHEPMYLPPTNVEPETYTEDTLLGMTGTVVQKYSDGSYLGKLTDKSQTAIVVQLDNAKEDDKFIIKKIENGKIFGSVVTL